MKCRFVICAIIICMGTFISHTYGINRLRVKDPKNPFRNGRGEIDEATITVHPKGIYTEVNFYLTFSAKPTTYTTPQDTLEVIYDFSLPKGSFVIDSWLWIRNDIVQATIIDRWSASEIYEGIVDHMQDPSLLVKNGDQYQLQIYPLVGNQVRKVRITCLIPNKWYADGSFGVNLPLSILNGSRNEPCGGGCRSGIPAESKVLLKDTSFYEVTSVAGIHGQYPIQASSTKGYKEIMVNGGDFDDDFYISYRCTKLKNGIFLTSFPTSQREGYYQMILLPSRALNMPVERKTVFLIDYDVTKSTVSKQQLFELLKRYIQINYTSQDKFAILFGSVPVEGTGNTWISGDSLAKVATFSTISASMISDHSNLELLLAKGAEFVKENTGDIVVIAASEHNYAPTTSNKLINDYVASLPPSSRFSCVDLCNLNQNSYYVSGLEYYGDGYFYSNVSRLKKGYYGSLKDFPRAQQGVYAYEDILSKAISANTTSISSFDVRTTMLNGFCSGRQNYSSTTQNITLSAPFMQVGRYVGRDVLRKTFIIEASATLGDKDYGYNFSIEEHELSFPDSIVRKAWEAKYILDHELLPKTTPNIVDIIDHSMRGRVLSDYTAFLSLDPLLGGQVCKLCKEEGEGPNPTGITESLAVDSATFSVFPVPTQKSISIVIKERNVSDHTHLQIFNSMGQMVYQQAISRSAFHRNRLEFHLDLEDERVFTNGTYFVLFQNGDAIKRAKFIVQR